MQIRVTDLAARIHADWDRQGLTARSPKPGEIPAAATDDLPAEFATFLDEVGLPDDMDEKLIRFWPPDEWIEVYEPASDNRGFFFADYMISAHRFGLWTSGDRRGSVSIHHSGEPEPPLGSFGQFLQMYLDDDPALWG